MSSTGIISRVIMTPTTGSAEVERHTDAAVSAYPGLHEGIRYVEGAITSVHEDRPLVKAHSDDGSPIADGRWIRLNHSVQDIAERFGTVRLGSRLSVMYQGPSGSDAAATIISSSKTERYASEKLVPNTVARGLFALFPPGIGIG
jgi:hypothetical protein